MVPSKTEDIPEAPSTTDGALFLRLVLAAKKQRKFIAQGQFGHSIACSQSNIKCECGISDILTTLEVYDKKKIIDNAPDSIQTVLPSN